MKTKYWIVLFGALAVVLGIVSLLLLPRGEAAAVEVWSEGKLIQVLDLAVDTRLEVKTQRGVNTVVVAGGKAFVEEADCPDGTCMAQGKKTAGQIVCLPNRLVLKFTGKAFVDGISG